MVWRHVSSIHHIHSSCIDECSVTAVRKALASARIKILQTFTIILTLPYVQSVGDVRQLQPRKKHVL